MTIRKRLVLAVASGSTLITLAAIGANLALYGASLRVQAVTELQVAAVDPADRTARCAEQLSQQINELIESRLSGNFRRVRNLSIDIAARFDAVDSTLQAPTSMLADGPTLWPQHAANLREAARSFREDWMKLRDVRLDDPQWRQVLELDETAVAFLESTKATQDAVDREMAVRMTAARTYIHDVIWFTAVFSFVLIGVAIYLGVRFSNALSGRLEKLRLRAAAVGAGDLSDTVDISSHNDEVDHVASAFNGMVRALVSSRRQLEHDALHDPLTQLPNRALFLERLDRRIAEAKRHDDYKFAVMFIDLDRFKLINDSMGHCAGDQLLCAVAERLANVIRRHGEVTGQQDTLSRLGGDEFTILLTVCDEDGAVAAADAVNHALSAPFQLDNREITVTASVGVAIGSEETTHANAIMSDADAALYRAKDGGRNGHAIFDTSMRDEVVARLRIENDLRHALQNNEFVSHFQPIFDLNTGTLLGFEALIRWARGGELIQPSSFISIAEETGLIVKIGEWMLENTCAQFAKWLDRFGRPLVLTVNVSRRQLADPAFLPHLRKVLAKTGLPPNSLAIEVTESMLGELGLITNVIEALHAMGVLIYIDDFGTGYSTLSCLFRFPIDAIKLDRSFIRSDAHRDHMAVLNTAVQMAHDLRVPVVAEGVETLAQVAALQAIACDRAQGFHFARPMIAEDAERLIESPTLRREVA